MLTPVLLHAYERLNVILFRYVLLFLTPSEKKMPFLNSQTCSMFMALIAGILRVTIRNCTALPIAVFINVFTALKSKIHAKIRN